MIMDLLAVLFIYAQGFFIYRFLNKKKKTALKPSKNVSNTNFINAKVLYVFDGDTVSVSINGKEVIVRLDSIDCPESKQTWGNIATAGLIKMIGGREVLLETYGLDIYGRRLATVYVDNGYERINVNERMVMLGHAWVYRSYYHHLSEFRKGQLNLLESIAIMNKRGLWRTENPLAPWEYRRLAKMG